MNRKEIVERVTAWIGVAIGLATVGSILFYTFTGLPLWAPVNAMDFRALLLIVVHMAGLAIGGASAAFLATEDGGNAT